MEVTSTRISTFSLAIDTSAGTSVAVLDMGTVLAELNYPEPMTHSERIGAAIEKVLADANVRPSQISQVVAGVGPGPFTGLRVGLAAAQFFALGAKADLVAVCSLDAIALDYFAVNPGSKALLVSTDARRKEVFWASYQGVTNGIPVRVLGPSVNKPEDLSEFINLEEHERTELVVRAASLGQIAFAQSLTELGPDRDLTPIYLREPDAVPTKPKKVSG
jgi:tRNA threonylcarbamoyl adenosine modification protein YeaZ